jgi:Helix-turn-helix of DDE superfamily endonuclease
MTVYQGTSFTPELTAAGHALFRAGVKVSAGTCGDLAAPLERRHRKNRTRRRLLSPLAQAVLVIAFLRTNLTYAELAAGFGISESTCWRDVREGISVLADRGRRISLADVARLAVKVGWDYLIVDGVHVLSVTFGRKRQGNGPITPGSTSATG